MGYQLKAEEYGAKCRTPPLIFSALRGTPSYAYQSIGQIHQIYLDLLYYY